MKAKSIYMTDSLAAAIKKAAHKSELSQHQFILSAIVNKLEGLNDQGVQDLLSSHIANVEAAAEERQAKRHKGIEARERDYKASHREED